MACSIAILLTCAALALASPYRLKEFHPAPREWKPIGRAPVSHTIQLQIGLKQGQFDELEKSLYEVSDPEHHRYGQHLTADEVNDLIKPADDSLNLVESWLSEHRIDPLELDYSPAKDWITVSLPVEDVERLLDTRYSVWRHEDGSHVVRTQRWSLPTHLHEHIVSIQPTNSFFRPSPKGFAYRRVGEIDLADLALDAATIENPTVDSVCNTSAVTSLCLRTFYETLDYVPQAPGKNKVALNNYLNETSNYSDVNIFLEHYRPDAVGFNFSIEVINNGSNQQTPNTPEQNKKSQDIEGNLDAETILGITYPTPLIAYNTGGEPPILPANATNSNEPYSIFLNYILAKSNDELPQVISTSYADGESSVPFSYATAVCRQYAQLGARGVSVFFSSGDSGVGSCASSTQFSIGFPASCPYVTAVGATKDFDPEVVAHDPANGFTSGGGYSKYFTQPAYQKDVVTAYNTALGNAFPGQWNPAGRAYPDIAAQGQHFVEIWDGSFITVDGTSASTPLAAGIISLVNDALLAAGKPPLGFLNPWLYKSGYKAFNDITTGSAIGCNTTGFPAAAGWDPVTGFGTPNFPKLKDLALATAGKK